MRKSCPAASHGTAASLIPKRNVERWAALAA